MYKTFSIFLVCLTFVSINSFDLPQYCGKSDANVNGLIEGGGYALEGEFPWQVLLAEWIGGQWSDQCGGTIIANRWVLTAAHCYQNNYTKSHYLVRLGVHNRTEHQTNEFDFSADLVLAHPGWDESKVANDIGLIKLNETLDFDGKHKSLKPICLPNTLVKVSDKCQDVGFGMTGVSAGLSPVLKKLNTKIVDSNICQKELPSFYNNTIEVCTRADDQGVSGVCSGDSGGPLICLGSDDKWYQMGVTSYGAGGCNHDHFAEVFSRVSYYTDWIQDVVKNN